MALFFRDNGRKMPLMDAEGEFFPMDKYTKDNGKTAKCTAKASSSNKTALPTLANGRTIFSTVTVTNCILLSYNMKETTSTESNKATVF